MIREIKVRKGKEFLEEMKRRNRRGMMADR